MGKRGEKEEEEEEEEVRGDKSIQFWKGGKETPSILKVALCNFYNNQKIATSLHVCVCVIINL